MKKIYHTLRVLGAFGFIYYRSPEVGVFGRNGSFNSTIGYDCSIGLCGSDFCYGGSLDSLFCSGRSGISGLLRGRGVYFGSAGELKGFFAGRNTVLVVACGIADSAVD